MTNWHPFKQGGIKADLHCLEAAAAAVAAAAAAAGKVAVWPQAGSVAAALRCCCFLLAPPAHCQHSPVCGVQRSTRACCRREEINVSQV